MGKSTRIGLDISTSSVRAAQLSVKDGVFRLDRFAQMPLPVGAVVNGEVLDPIAVGTAIKHLWKAGRFKGKEVSIGVASQRVVVRQVDIPYMSPQDRAKALPLMVADQIPMPVDDAVLDFVPLEQVPGVDGATVARGLLVAAAEEPILASIAAAEAGGLTVTDVDLTPFATVRSLARADPLGMAVETEAVIDIGASTTTLVVHSNGIPQFVRLLMMGGQDVTTRLMEDLGVNLPTAESLKRETTLTDESAMASDAHSPAGVMSSVVQSLVEELRGSLDYFQATGTTVRLDRIILTGGGSLVPGFEQQLEEATGLPVRRGTALTALGPGQSGLSDDHLAFADPLSAAAVGLAIWDDV